MNNLCDDVRHVKTSCLKKIQWNHYTQGSGSSKRQTMEILEWIRESKVFLKLYLSTVVEQLCSLLHKCETWTLWNWRIHRYHAKMEQKRQNQWNYSQTVHQDAVSYPASAGQQFPSMHWEDPGWGASVLHWYDGVNMIRGGLIPLVPHDPASAVNTQTTVCETVTGNQRPNRKPAHCRPTYHQGPTWGLSHGEEILTGGWGKKERSEVLWHTSFVGFSVCAVVDLVRQCSLSPGMPGFWGLPPAAMTRVSAVKHFFLLSMSITWWSTNKSSTT